MDICKGEGRVVTSRPVRGRVSQYADICVHSRATNFWFCLSGTSTFNTSILMHAIVIAMLPDCKWKQLFLVNLGMGCGRLIIWPSQQFYDSWQPKVAGDKRSWLCSMSSHSRFYRCTKWIAVDVCRVGKGATPNADQREGRSNDYTFLWTSFMDRP